MGIEQLLVLAAATGQLALGVFVQRRAGRDPVALILALLCYVLAAWNISNWAYIQSEQPAWHVIDLSLGPWIPPVALHLVLAFVGARHAYQLWLRLAYAWFGLLSLASALSLVIPLLAEFVESLLWTIAFLVPFLLILASSVTLLWRHVRESHVDGERMRGMFMLLAVGLGGALGTSDLFDDLFVVPAMGALGSIWSTGMFAVVSLRLHMFGRELTTSHAFYAAGLGIVGMVAFLVIFNQLQGEHALMVLGSLTVCGLLCAAMIPVIHQVSLRRANERRLAGVGRFAEQMAHDIKNPLSAVKGATQFLQEERRQGRSIDQQDSFLELMDDELRHVDIIIERYRQLGACEPSLVSVDLNQVVRKVAALKPHAQDADVEVRLQLDEGLSPVKADVDLLGIAIENLIRNAAEAMSDGGTITIRTHVEEERGSRYTVLSVEDQGEGMDVRLRERAFEEFFTTKATGSGLGLSYVQRVAQAHGGRVEIDSSVGSGTQVKIMLPMVDEEVRP